MSNVLRRLWLDGRLYVANHLVARIPSHFLRLLFYRTMMKAKIGDGSSVFLGAWFDTPGGLFIGSSSTVNQRCRLDSRGGLHIGNNVSISAEVCILTAGHDIRSKTFAGVLGAVIICDYAFLGTRAMILPGVTVGEGAVVAAGAVVTKNVDPYTVVGGVPARVIGAREVTPEYSVVYRRMFQ